MELNVSFFYPPFFLQMDIENIQFALNIYEI